MPVTPPFYFSDGVAEYGVVVSIHNRADILERTLSSLLATTLGAWELALVLDACTDGSLAVAQRVLRARTPPCGGENLRRAVVFEVEGRAGHRALFETAADNLGMRMLEPTLAYVLVQPDVVFEERGWNLWLAAALTSDVFAVSARCVVRMDKPKGQRYLSRNQWCAGNRRRPRKAVPEESQFMALVAHHAPRGPLLLRASAMRALGFFDEGCHHLGGDDMELEWLALSRFGWRSAHVYADVHQLAKAHQNKGGGISGGAPPNTWWRREGVLMTPTPTGTGRGATARCTHLLPPPETAARRAGCSPRSRCGRTGSPAPAPRGPRGVQQERGDAQQIRQAGDAGRGASSGRR